MQIITIEHLPKGMEVSEVLGISRGSTVRARHIGHDIFATIKNIVGGELDEYTKLQADSREQATSQFRPAKSTPEAHPVREATHISAIPPIRAAAPDKASEEVID